MIMHRTSLPDSITRNGRRYILDRETSATIGSSSAPDHSIDVHVLARNLRGRLDLHGKPYQPSRYIFRPENPRYKVLKVFRVSNRRKLIRKGLTKQEAQTLVNSFPSSMVSMVVFMQY